MITYITIGTPITGVMALIGITPVVAAPTESHAQSSAVAAPHRAVAGSSEV